MFVASEEGGVGFWDMESRLFVAGDTDFFGLLFGMMDGWGLLRDKDRHGQTWEQVRASTGSSWEDYTPRPGWNEGRKGDIQVKADVKWGAVWIDVGLAVSALALDAVTFLTPIPGDEEIALGLTLSQIAKAGAVIESVFVIGSIGYDLSTSRYVERYIYRYRPR